MERKSLRQTKIKKQTALHPFTHQSDQIKLTCLQLLKALKSPQHKFKLKFKIFIQLRHLRILLQLKELTVVNNQHRTLVKVIILTDQMLRPVELVQVLLWVEVR